MGSSTRSPMPALLLLLLLAAVVQHSSGQLDLRQLASLLASQWRAGQRSGRALGPAQLLASSQLIIIPKLEITSPSVPRDGGSFQLYADFPISLGGLGGLGGGSFFAASDRNDTVTDASPPSPPSPPSLPSPPSPPSSPPPPPPSADASPVRPPAPPADAVVPLRNPTIIMSYDRRRARDGDGAPLPSSGGFHDVAQQVLARLGMDGRVCLLRAVCQLSARPLRSNGLLGDLINAVAEIPSTSSRSLEEELKVARRLGLSGAPCTAVFDSCDNIIINALDK